MVPMKKVASVTHNLNDLPNRFSLRQLSFIGEPEKYMCMCILLFICMYVCITFAFNETDVCHFLLLVFCI